MYRVASVQDWAVDSERTAWLALAEQHYRLSLDLRASDPLVWALLANTLEESGKLGQIWSFLLPNPFVFRWKVYIPKNNMTLCWCKTWLMDGLTVLP